MIAARCLEKLILESGKNRNGIEHFLKVYAYAKTIGEQEGLSPAEMEILEIAAVIHDIACPLCREKYGSAPGHLQEQESGPLVDRFLGEVGCAPEVIDRVRHLVTRHHTYTGVDGMDWQILLEADFLVNAGENGMARPAIEAARIGFFRTKTGIALLESIYL